MAPASSVPPSLLNKARIFFKWASLSGQRWALDCISVWWTCKKTLRKQSKLNWESLLSKMFWTTAAWSFWAFSIADWQKTPCGAICQPTFIQNEGEVCPPQWLAYLATVSTNVAFLGMVHSPYIVSARKHICLHVMASRHESPNPLACDNI